MMQVQRGPQTKDVVVKIPPLNFGALSHNDSQNLCLQKRCGLKKDMSLKNIYHFKKDVTRGRNFPRPSDYAVNFSKLKSEIISEYDFKLKKPDSRLI